MGMAQLQDPVLQADHSVPRPAHPPAQPLRLCFLRPLPLRDLSPLCPVSHRLKCACQHNTCGGSCERCCPGFNQQQWKPATPESANECQCECLPRAHVLLHKLMQTHTLAVLTPHMHTQCSWIYSHMCLHMIRARTHTCTVLTWTQVLTSSCADPHMHAHSCTHTSLHTDSAHAHVCGCHT